MMPDSISRMVSSRRTLRELAVRRFFVFSERLNFRPPNRKLMW